MSAAPQPYRQHFQQPLSTEFFTFDGLRKRTGQPRSRFLDVILKELIDNAIDAAESAGRPPEVSVRADQCGDDLLLSVSDNGDGIPTDLVKKILDFDGGTISDKAAYKAPTRGQQGNAFKTIIGIPRVMGADRSRIRIEAQGHRHEITAWLDPSGTPRTTHTIEAIEHRQGSVITVRLPDRDRLDSDTPAAWVQAFALFNPHVKISANGDWLENASMVDEVEKNADFYATPTNPAWERYFPGEYTSPHWYDAEAFAYLVQVTINKGTNQTVRQFVSTFKGCTGTTKPRQICEGLPQRLSDLDNDPDAVRRLHHAMLIHAKPELPKALGVIGKDHFCQSIPTNNRHWYKAIKGTDERIPFVVEAFLAESELVGTVFGLNGSRAFSDPLTRCRLECLDNPPICTYGVESVLEACDATDLHGFSFALHIMSPGFSFGDFGKTELDLSQQPELRQAVQRALSSVCKVAYKEKKARDRDASRQAQEFEMMLREDKANPRALVWEHLLQAWEIATDGGSHVVSARILFYKTRELIAHRLDKPLNYDSFSQSWVPAFQRHTPLKGFYYDPRGFLIEPHTNDRTEVGTLEADAYTMPDHLYDKVLFIEKKGLMPILEQADIARRYDMAILCSEGFSVVAARSLLVKLAAKHCTVFVLHDADAEGYNIARTLGEPTARMPDHHLEVIDLGLTVAMAEALGIEPEPRTRKKALPKGLIPHLTPQELELFTGRKVGYKQYQAHRFELSALTAKQLIELLTAGLDHHGAGKLLPPAEVCTDRALDCYSTTLRERIVRTIQAELNIDAIAREAMRGLPGLTAPESAEQWITQHWEADRSASWEVAVTTAVRDQITALEAQIRKAAMDSLIAALENRDK